MHTPTTTIPRRPPADVVLLSAGPGDLDLLTLKAIKALATAEVLLVDDLVNPDIVELAPHARVVRVGKRAGCRSIPQDFICRLMRRYALQGIRVVRVKGGDALMFGRAGEEIEFLADAGIRVRIINGISAAFAAAATLGVSLTHRDHCHGITFVTAHTRDHGEPDWAMLAATGTTLAIYMGMRRLPSLAASLVRHMPGSTPVAIVQCASRPGEHRLLTTLDSLIQSPLPPLLPRQPGVILVGNVLDRAALADPMQDPAAHPVHLDTESSWADAAPLSTSRQARRGAPGCARTSADRAGARA